MNKGQYILKPSVYFHPGEDLEEKLQEMGMSVAECAKMSLVPERVINDIIAGDASITSDVAFALEHVTKIPAKMWIRAQHDYDNYILSQEGSSWTERIIRLSQRVASVAL